MHPKGCMLTGTIVACVSKYTKVDLLKLEKLHNFDSRENQMTQIQAFERTLKKKIFDIIFMEIRRHTKKLWPNKFKDSFGTYAIESHEP